MRRAVQSTRSCHTVVMLCGAVRLAFSRKADRARSPDCGSTRQMEHLGQLDWMC